MLVRADEYKEFHAVRPAPFTAVLQQFHAARKLLLRQYVFFQKVLQVVVITAAHIDIEEPAFLSHQHHSV